jgi:transposase
MPVVYGRCAGVDVHQKTVVACVSRPAGRGGWGQGSRPCGTVTVELLALADGLLARGGTPVALERTGDYWPPGCTILEGTCAVWLVNARHVKAVPGRKTEVNEAAWLAAPWPQGWWRAHVIPPVAQRELRDLTRDRSPCSQARVPLINRAQQRVEEAHSKLAAVASDIMGGSGRAILAALLTGPAAPQALAESAKGRLRSTRDP